MMALSDPRTEGPVATVCEQPPDVHLNRNVRGLSQSPTIAITGPQRYASSAGR